MNARMARPRLAAFLGMIWFVLGTSPAGGQDAPADQVPLSATFVTEGVLPATEIETGFSFISSDAERQYQFGLSSLQYAWGTTFGLKLVVPFAVIDPRDDGASVAGPGDVQLLAKYTPLVSRAHLFALGAAVKLTMPTGSEPRGLGGMLALAPGLLAGKAWRLGDTILSVQADTFYGWQLDKPARAGTDPPSSPDREQRLAANVTAALAVVRWLTAILEVNSVTVIAGDPGLRGRVQVYLTPGVSLEPTAGWSVRVGVQVPLTSARELDYNAIFLATRGF